jgi:Bifunctional DNA primase/polymerase, N-terminal
MKNENTLPPTRYRDAAGFDLRVFPVQAQDKKPAGAWARYQTEAASDQDLVRWDQSDHNVGVVTGAASGIVVLDLFRSVPR